MAVGASSGEFEDFVGSVVPLEDIEQSHSGAPFENLMGRIAGERGQLVPSSAVGGGLLILAGGLAALLPDPADIRASHFWRVARSMGAQVVSIGNEAALPLVAVGTVLLALCLVLTYRAQAGAELVGAIGTVGVAGIALIALLWAALAVLWLVNLAVMVLIIIAYIIGAIIAIGVFIGMLMGLASS
jgi:hypothetical protein